MNSVSSKSTTFIATECKKNGILFQLLLLLLRRRFRFECVSLCFVILRLINKRNTITFKRSAAALSHGGVCVRANTQLQRNIHQKTVYGRKTTTSKYNIQYGVCVVMTFFDPIKLYVSGWLTIIHPNSTSFHFSFVAFSQHVVYGCDYGLRAYNPNIVWN